ncbi:helix-turn-helix domain-containing protein [Rhizohabitans arisaemae]|uniref:helix-turn-helix domain-containing protein n=1 Tax=Rhizohabitans arisaemae TaxID=2720610 RepID=UPI0024B0F56A|nr:helix-turn-helix transcriptional regulator [Rhizohabitans arisaemae]
MDARKEIGQRIARARRRRGWSQHVLAGLVGRSESWLSQVERGRRSVDSHTVLVGLAEHLGLPVEELSLSGPADDLPRFEPAIGIGRAMMGYEGLEALIDPRYADGSTPSLRRLRHELHAVNRLYQSTKYHEAARRLPALIVAAEFAARTGGPGRRRDGQTLRALVYHATATMLSRVGESRLAWTAGDRSLHAAEEAGLPMLAAVSAYRLGYVFIRLGEADRAKDIVLRAAEALERGVRRAGPRRLSMWGALHLVAVTAAAARFDRAETDRFLGRARQAAERLGADRNDFWTAFGPTNVEIHQVSVSVAFGDARYAVRRAEAIDLTRLAPGLRGRRAQIHIDLARAYAVQGKDAAAVNMLLQAERLSPELIRYGVSTGRLLAQLLKREHRVSTPELRALAHRAGVS